MNEDSGADVSLDALRDRLEHLDRSILELLAARLVLATAAIQTRTDQGEEVTDRVQERKVLERARLWSEELGVPPEIVRGLFRALLRAGKDRFRQEGAPASANGNLAGSSASSVRSLDAEP